MATVARARPRGRHVLAAALRTRATGSMLAFGLSSGLPFSLLIGTVTAWLGEAKVDLKTVGVLAFAQLAYAFKFLWSPLVDRVRLPLAGRLGQRKGWIVACQGALVLCLLALAATDPSQAIGRFAVIAVLGALASATQDVAIDGWRIDVADEATPVELLSSVYQLGYRTAAIIGGAFALHLAGQMSWPGVYAVMAALMAALLVAGLFAPERQVPPREADAQTAWAGDPPRVRAAALAVVGLCWAGALVAIGRFMVLMLAPLPPGAARPSAADFLKYQGAAIVVATVLVHWASRRSSTARGGRCARGPRPARSPARRATICIARWSRRCPISSLGSAGACWW